ncbi:hypothetical protein [Oceanidesulfovibrio marinus]|uniref:Uncharacterized protein n=1 Tax=Oceanidesulfovibrio marinus TaxID=370038 RepID=A0A6P1ZFB2_9BACT|nr:hypothetical protein [Oceanidesulfovibrio marinus]QJT07874.1 hypothetical protein E8L03_02560 [Oceanidesulfovibrio marinus]TVM33374.1 hypothetical protein DQK91_11965 [Oceanidesulfovibrio marinus]
MKKNDKPLTPVKPSSMELVFFYPCPFCQRQVPLIGPTQPTMAQCDACKGHFPIVPVDDKSIQFVKIMLANGRAGVDPDFL